MSNNELYHYGVLGMKWGQRRAMKRKTKYLDKTDNMSKVHLNTSKTYAKNAKKIKSISDKDYAKRFDDKELLKERGGIKKAKEQEIKYYEQKSKDHARYAKDWIDAHNEIMNTPVDTLKSRKYYEEIINKYLNR